MTEYYHGCGSLFDELRPGSSVTMLFRHAFAHATYHQEKSQNGWVIVISAEESDLRDRDERDRNERNAKNDFTAEPDVKITLRPLKVLKAIPYKEAKARFNREVMEGSRLTDV